MISTSLSSEGARQDSFPTLRHKHDLDSRQYYGVKATRCLIHTMVGSHRYRAHHHADHLQEDGCRKTDFCSNVITSGLPSLTGASFGSFAGTGVVISACPSTGPSSLSLALCSSFPSGPTCSCEPSDVCIHFIWVIYTSRAGQSEDEWFHQEWHIHARRHHLPPTCK